MIVTADALQTQVKNARFIVEDKGADYISPVKQNQGNLFETIRNNDMVFYFPTAHCSDHDSPAVFFQLL